MQNIFPEEEAMARLRKDTAQTQWWKEESLGDLQLEPTESAPARAGNSETPVWETM